MKNFIAFIAAVCMALPAMAAPKKEDRGKGKKTEKEVPAMMWTVVVEGATGETAAEEVKAFLSGIKGAKVESVEKKENTVEAVISSKERLSRSDVSKALKEKKEFKVKDFKTKRPDKDADKKDGDKKETAKEGDKKPETKKEGDTKPDAPKKP